MSEEWNEVPITVCYDPLDEGPLWHYEITDQSELESVIREYGELEGFYAYPKRESLDFPEISRNFLQDSWPGDDIFEFQEEIRKSSLSIRERFRIDGVDGLDILLAVKFALRDEKRCRSLPEDYLKLVRKNLNSRESAKLIIGYPLYPSFLPFERYENRTLFEGIQIEPERFSFQDNKLYLDLKLEVNVDSRPNGFERNQESPHLTLINSEVGCKIDHQMEVMDRLNERRNEIQIEVTGLGHTPDFLYCQFERVIVAHIDSDSLSQLLEQVLGQVKYKTKFHVTLLVKFRQAS